MSAPVHCPVCGTVTRPLGTQRGLLDGRDFLFRRCDSCHFTFVENHRTDFQNIYDEAYYRGKGADPYVDYVYEFQNPNRTIRTCEWDGVRKVFHHFFPDGGRWLDFGCGSGGLVRSASDAGIDAYGFDDGWAASLGREGGTRILDDTALEIYAGTFDFVSAIEVLEHVSDPLAALRKIRRLLKPNGILFVTTGNARPWRDNPLAWSYTSIPDVHVSFYEPETLETCLRKCGFRTDNFPSSKLFVDIIKFKILKTLRLKDRHWLIDVLPWKMIAAVVDKRHQVSRHPYGVAD